MAPPSERTTYEVGTTALAPSEWELTEAGRYRERGTDGHWHERNGSVALSDAGATQMYSNFTPPGLPLAAGAVLDAKKRYVYDGGGGVKILAYVNEVNVWRVSSGSTLSVGTFVVIDDEIVREIMDPVKAGFQLADERDRARDALRRAVADRDSAWRELSEALQDLNALRSTLGRIREALDG